MSKFITLIFLLAAACGDDGKELHPCERYGLDFRWCDEEGRTNVCTREEDGKIHWYADTCAEPNWFCDEVVGDCRCTPGDTWCLYGAGNYGYDFAMTCGDAGNVAGGPACYGGCEENNEGAVCM